MSSSSSSSLSFMTMGGKHTTLGATPRLSPQEKQPQEEEEEEEEEEEKEDQEKDQEEEDQEQEQQQEEEKRRAENDWMQDEVLATGLDLAVRLPSVIEIVQNDDDATMTSELSSRTGNNPKPATLYERKKPRALSELDSSFKSDFLLVENDYNNNDVRPPGTPLSLQPSMVDTSVLLAAAAAAAVEISATSGQDLEEEDAEDENEKEEAEDENEEEEGAMDNVQLARMPKERADAKVPPAAVLDTATAMPMNTTTTTTITREELLRWSKSDNGVIDMVWKVEEEDHHDDGLPQEAKHASSPAPKDEEEEEEEEEEASSPVDYTPLVEAPPVSGKTKNQDEVARGGWRRRRRRRRICLLLLLLLLFGLLGTLVTLALRFVNPGKDHHFAVWFCNCSSLEDHGLRLAGVNNDNDDDVDVENDDDDNNDKVLAMRMANKSMKEDEMSWSLPPLPLQHCDAIGPKEEGEEAPMVHCRKWTSPCGDEPTCARLENGQEEKEEEEEEALARTVLVETTTTTTTTTTKNGTSYASREDLWKDDSTLHNVLPTELKMKTAGGDEEGMKHEEEEEEEEQQQQGKIDVVPLPMLLVGTMEEEEENTEPQSLRQLEVDVVVPLSRLIVDDDNDDDDDDSPLWAPPVLVTCANVTNEKEEEEEVEKVVHYLDDEADQLPRMAAKNDVGDEDDGEGDENGHHGHWNLLLVQESWSEVTMTTTTTTTRTTSRSDNVLEEPALEKWRSSTLVWSFSLSCIILGFLLLWRRLWTTATTAFATTRRHKDHFGFAQGQVGGAVSPPRVLKYHDSSLIVPSRFKVDMVNRFGSCVQVTRSGRLARR